VRISRRFSYTLRLSQLTLHKDIYK
jgi:hypothetical protein